MGEGIYNSTFKVSNQNIHMYKQGRNTQPHRKKVSLSGALQKTNKYPLNV